MDTCFGSQLQCFPCWQWTCPRIMTLIILMFSQFDSFLNLVFKLTQLHRSVYTDNLLFLALLNILIRVPLGVRFPPPPLPPDAWIISVIIFLSSQSLRVHWTHPFKCTNAQNSSLHLFFYQRRRPLPLWTLRYQNAATGTRMFSTTTVTALNL